ncbi:hypothetical protein EsH8_VIII_000177 [Colletotrichum jinshuiense]
MRRLLALILALVAYTLARAIPDGAGPISASREIAFTASNGSDVVFNIGQGLGFAEDARHIPSPIAKHIIVRPADGYMALCTVRASQQDSGIESPRRDDCQALYDFIKNHNIFIYFEDFDADLGRWAEIVWVGSCAFRAQSYTRNVVFANGDIANFLDRSLSRPSWTIDGRISAAGEADCAAWNSNSGTAPVFWRLQQRGPLPSAFHDTLAVDNNAAIEARETKPNQPLVVESFTKIPQNTSAYVFDGAVHEVPDIASAHDITITKRFEIFTGRVADGPFCDPVWLSSDWNEPNIPLKSDCNSLWEFVKHNTATVIFKERDLNFWAKFAAHGTCGISFMTTKEKIWITSRDMAGFLERALNYEPANTRDRLHAKMGVRCGFESSGKYDGEFRLFYRDPNLPLGQLERRDSAKAETTEGFSAESKMPTPLIDENPLVNWVDFTAADQDGNNVTVQLNSRALAASSPQGQLDARLERYDTPLGPSKRCTGKTKYFGGAHPDSALVNDCVKLRNFMSIRRFYWKFNQEEYSSPNATPLAKVDTCHFAFRPYQNSIFGNMDLEIILTGAIDQLDNTKGRMRGWGDMWCDLDGQFGEKRVGRWAIYP